jgi:hypothetical protein
MASNSPVAKGITLNMYIVGIFVAIVQRAHVDARPTYPPT